jgi:hypothetical protein
MLTAAAKRASKIFLRTEPLPSAEVKSKNGLSQAVLDRYRCPPDFLEWDLSGPLSFDEGYFRFGANSTCYGRSCQGARKLGPKPPLHDALGDVVVQNAKLRLPFDPTEILDNLRLERYNAGVKHGFQNFLRKMYYHLRPFMNLTLRAEVQKFRARNWEKAVFPKWPVDTTVEDVCETLLLLSLKAKNVEKVPFVWFWPNGSNGCVTMTHDVENEAGWAFCAELMDLNDSFGIKSSFQIIPEKRYEVSRNFLESISSRGFEVAVHDLNHDGHLYDDRKEFLRRAKKINQYGVEWGAKGFRAAVLYRKPDWFDSLDFSYDMSIPNVAHLDPQSGGCCTVMPYFIEDILEIPVTTIQDYMLFHVIQNRSIDLWKNQIEMILQKNGLASFIVHPDYIIERETRSVYENLLGYLRDLRSQIDVWFALPHEINNWWRSRSQMRIEKYANSWRIEGEGAERAVLAYARNVDGRLIYEVERAAACQADGLHGLTPV